MEYGIFFDSGNYRADYIRKYSNKTAVEICKSYECPNVFNAYKSFPILNSFNFLGVHTDAFDRNDQSQITIFSDVEFTFVNLCL